MMEKININLRWRFILTGFGCLLISNVAIALPFGTFDARTMAMGGVGVATGARAAIFNNPALLTTADDIHEWFVLFPTVGRQLDDPGELETGLDDFKQAADVLDATNNLANRNAVVASLNAIDGSRYRVTNNIAAMLAIPSRFLSGAVFLNSYEISNVQVVIDSNDLSAPVSPYSSTLIHRGVRVVENGVSAAKVLESKGGWADGLAVGFSAKLLLIKTYGYVDDLRTADLKISNASGQNASQFGLDVGVLKEFGVWKIALMAKNLFSAKYNYGSSNDVMKIDPQLRAGFAYQSRYSTLELDFDLTENEPVGFDYATQMAALGWEWRPWGGFVLRAGYKQNLAETGVDSSGVSSAGIGLFFSGIHIDVGAYSGDVGEGASAQFGVQF